MKSTFKQRCGCRRCAEHVNDEHYIGKAELLVGRSMDLEMHLIS